MKKFYFMAFMTVIVCLTGCKDRISVQPDRLPVAYLNKPYTATVDITGGKVISYSVGIDFSDKNFRLQNKKEDDNFNHLVITGTPTSLTPIKVSLGGSTYGTMRTGQDFEKDYVIEVKEK